MGVILLIATRAPSWTQVSGERCWVLAGMLWWEASRQAAAIGGGVVFEAGLGNVTSMLLCCVRCCWREH